MQFKEIFHKLPIVFKIRLSESNQTILINKHTDNFMQYGDLKIRSITSDNKLLVYTLY